MKTFSNPSTVAAPLGKYSHAVVIDLGSTRMIMTAGQVAVDKEGRVVGKGDIAAQADCAFENTKAILEANGATMRDIVKMNIYVTDMDGRAELGEVRARYLGDHAPCSTLVEVSRLASPDFMIEIEVTAVVSQ